MPACKGRDRDVVILLMLVYKHIVYSHIYTQAKQHNNS